MNDLAALLLTMLLIAGNAFFVGAEFAVIAGRRDRLDALARKGETWARKVLLAGQQLPLLMAGAQLGVTICSLGLGALAEPAIAHLLSRPFETVGVPTPVLHGAALTGALAIVVTLHTVLGELVPKNLALAGPERAARWLVPAHFAFCRAVRPLLTLLNVLARGILRLIRVQPRDDFDTAYTPDELAELIGESRREGLLDASEHRRLAKTLSSTARTVADVLVPLHALTTVPERPTMGDLEAAISATGFSRFPLRDRNGGLTGYLHVKDVLDLATAKPSTPVPHSRTRGLPEVPTDARLDDALTALRRAHSHLAKAVGANGTVLGVVALEDLVEEYVGDVRDGTHIRG